MHVLIISLTISMILWLTINCKLIIGFYIFIIIVNNLIIIDVNVSFIFKRVNKLKVESKSLNKKLEQIKDYLSKLK